MRRPSFVYRRTIPPLLFVAPAALAAAALIAIVVAFIITSRITESRHDNLNDETEPFAFVLADVEGDASSLAANAQALLFTDNAAFIERLATARAQLEADAARMSELAGPAGFQDEAGAIDVLIQRYLGITDQYLAEASAGNPFSARLAISTTGAPALEALTVEIDATQPLVRERIQDLRDGIINAERAQFITLAISIPIVVGSALILVLLGVISGRLLQTAQRNEALARLREAALSESEERFRTVADASPVLIWMAGTDRLHTYFNKGWIDFTGRPFASEIADGWTDGIHSDDREARLEVYTTAFARREPFELEYRLRRHDGDYRWILDRGVPLFEADGTFAGYIGGCIDVTDRRRAEDELRRSNEAKDEFLGMVSHELRTPITTLYGGVNVLARRGSSLGAESRQQLLDDMETDAHRLKRIVEQLLILARLERGQHVATEPLLAQRVIERLATAFEERQADHPLTVRIDEHLGAVLAEPTYFEQVVQNLLSNAEKYSPPAAPIELRASVDGGSEAVFSVLDRGRGVRPDETERIFEHFYRSRGTTESGAGMGLTVCKRLVDAMAGRIWAKPREGGGLEVSFALPLYDGDAEPAKSEPVAASRSWS